MNPSQNNLDSYYNKTKQTQKPPKNTRHFIIIGLIAIFILIIITIGIWFQTRPWEEPEPAQLNRITESDLNLPSNLTTSPTQTSTTKTENVNEFVLLVSGEIARGNNSYTYKEDFTPQILDEINRSIYQTAIQSQKTLQSIYIIETVTSSGKKEAHHVSAFYCPPNSYVCEDLTTREIPQNTQASLSPTVLIMNKNISTINIYINNNLIASLTRPSNGPNITRFDKTTATQNINNKPVDGYEISWDIQNNQSGQSWISLQYKSSENKWETGIFGSAKDYINHFVQPDNIQSTYKAVDYRLIVTDGFNAQKWEEKGFISVGKRDIYASLPELRDEYVIGQYIGIELTFIDPETGQGCDGQGCTNGINAGKYEVTWTSDKQPLESDDIYNGVVEYLFKVPGKHTITAVIQHKEKPELRKELSTTTYVK